MVRRGLPYKLARWSQSLIGLILFVGCGSVGYVESGTEWRELDSSNSGLVSDEQETISVRSKPSIDNPILSVAFSIDQVSRGVNQKKVKRKKYQVYDKVCRPFHYFDDQCEYNPLKGAALDVGFGLLTLGIIPLVFHFGDSDVIVVKDAMSKPTDEILEAPLYEFSQIRRGSVLNSKPMSKDKQATLTIAIANSDLDDNDHLSQNDKEILNSLVKSLNYTAKTNTKGIASWDLGKLIAVAKKTTFGDLRFDVGVEGMSEKMRGTIDLSPFRRQYMQQEAANKKAERQRYLASSEFAKKKYCNAVHAQSYYLNLIEREKKVGRLSNSVDMVRLNSFGRKALWCEETVSQYKQLAAKRDGSKLSPSQCGDPRKFYTEQDCVYYDGE